MYNTVLFDLDGTLTDPVIGITNSVIYALEKWNIKVADRRELYCFIGPPLSWSFEKYYGFSPEDSLRAVEYYREYFGVKGLFENELYSGTVELLKTLKRAGKKLIIATSKPEKYAVEILKHFGIEKYFDFVAGATMDETRNKKGDVIAFAIEQSGITDLKGTVMVGDRDQDVLGAKQNGLDCIGVLYGYGDLEEIRSAGATHIAETTEDILDIIIKKDRFFLTK